MARFDTYAKKTTPVADDTVLLYDSENRNNKQMRYGDLTNAIIEQFSNEFLERYKALIGTPLTTSTASQMTDEEKIYVYTGSETGYTAGHWYYYDGSTWTDGGVYNAVAVSTDKTLTVQDKAADAKVVGDEIADLKADLNSVIALEPIETRTYYPLQMGACFAAGVSIDDMRPSMVIATVPQRISAKKVMTLWWDDSVYRMGLVPLHDDGTGAGSYYWNDTAPYTTTVATTALYRTFMVRRKDDADIGAVDLTRILYKKETDSNPILDRITEGEETISTETDEKIANALDTLSDYSNGFAKYTFPNEFSWSDNPVVDKVSTDGKGNFRVNYRVMDHVSTDGLDVYMAADGSDSNDGLTAETPKQTLAAAIDIVNARRVHIAGGSYPRVEIASLSKDIDLLGDPDDRPVFTGQSSNIVWTATGTTGVFTTAHKNYGKLYDLTTIEDGMFRLYAETDSITEVRNTQGTFYDDGTTLTMHSFGDAIPTVENTCYTQGFSAMRIVLSGHTVLAANLCFICGGGYSSRGQLMFDGTEENRGTFLMFNCDSSYSNRFGGGSGGSCYNPHYADGILQLCTSYHSYNDGFSYGYGCRIVEIGCASAFNGNEELTSCNGSTAHGGSYIRINGAYHDTHGPVVHDVGATESVNLGLAAWHSTCAGKPNFCASGGAVKMWLDSCLGYSSDAGIDVGKPDESAPNAIIYKRNCQSDVEDRVYGGHIYRY